MGSVGGAGVGVKLDPHRGVHVTRVCRAQGGIGSIPRPADLGERRSNRDVPPVGVLGHRFQGTAVVGQGQQHLGGRDTVVVGDGGQGPVGRAYGLERVVVRAAQFQLEGLVLLPHVIVVEDYGKFKPGLARRDVHSNDGGVFKVPFDAKARQCWSGRQLVVDQSNLVLRVPAPYPVEDDGELHRPLVFRHRAAADQLQAGRGPVGIGFSVLIGDADNARILPFRYRAVRQRDEVHPEPLPFLVNLVLCDVDDDVG